MILKLLWYGIKSSILLPFTQQGTHYTRVYTCVRERKKKGREREAGGVGEEKEIIGYY